MSETHFIAEPGLPQIVAMREFSARRELVYRAHVEADLLVRWIGPAGLESTVDLLEPRHGGRWRYTHRDTAGNTYSFHGLYHGDPSPEQIIQTYEFDAEPGVVYLNILDLAALTSGTRLRQNTVFPSVEDRDRYLDSGAEQGLTQSYERLDRLVAEMEGDI